MNNSEPWAIPESWRWVRAGQIADIVGGSTPRTDDLSNFDNGDIPWITPADLSGYTSKFISQGARNITRKGLENSGARLMPAGTVLFSSRAPIGYVAIASNPVCTNQGFKSFVLSPLIRSDYAYYYFLRARELAIELSSGTTFREISAANAAVIAFPVAPLNEQDRIVKEIEKQLPRVDAAVTALKRVQINLKRYRAAVLKAACEGRLVPTEAELSRGEGRTFEPASELLKRILVERRARWETALLGNKRNVRSSRYDEPQPPNTSDLPSLPDGWVWTTAEQLSDETRAITYGVIKLGQEIEGGIPTLRSSDVRHLRLDLAAVKRISATIAQDYRRTFLHGGELLVTVRGTLGGIVVVPSSCDGFNISREVAMVALVDEELGPAISFFIASDLLQHWLIRHAKGIAYTGINIETLKQLPIPLPPKDEQLRIAAEVERRLSIIDGIQAQLTSDLKRADGLGTAILNRAFQGKLVPQDPGDEPAIALLERIRAERDTRIKAKRVPSRRAKKQTQTVEAEI